MGGDSRRNFSHQLSNRLSLEEHKSKIIRVHLSSRVTMGGDAQKNFSHQLSNRLAPEDPKSKNN